MEQYPSDDNCTIALKIATQKQQQRQKALLKVAYEKRYGASSISAPSFSLGIKSSLLTPKAAVMCAAI